MTTTVELSLYTGITRLRQTINIKYKYKKK